MPRYSTIDFHSNPSELDPCIAAQVRLKDKHHSWKVIGGGIAILLTVIVAVIVVCALSFSSNRPSISERINKQKFKVIFDSTEEDFPTSTRKTVISNSYITKSAETSPPTLSTTTTAMFMKTSRPTIQAAKTAYSTQADKALVQKRQRKIQANEVMQIDTYGRYFETCDDYFRNGFATTGVYRLQNIDHYDFYAQCIMNDDKDGRAWMVMQKRTSDSLPFWNRTYEEYAQGFGDPRADSWIGLRQVTVVEAGEDAYYIGVWRFAIDSEKDDFKLHVSKILNGNFTDPLSNIANSNGLQFNAIQQEGTNLFNCLERVHMGGWWTVDNGCPFISLNGEYSCARANSMYGLSVYYRRPNRVGTFTTSYIRPDATLMSIHVCNGEAESKCPNTTHLIFIPNTGELDPCLAASVRLRTGKEFSWKWIGVILTLVLLLIAGIAVACILLIPSGQSTVDSLDKSSEQLHDTKNYLPSTNQTDQSVEVVETPFKRSPAQPDIAPIQKPVIFVPTRPKFHTKEINIKAEEVKTTQQPIIEQPAIEHVPTTEKPRQPIVLPTEPKNVPQVATPQKIEYQSRISSGGIAPLVDTQGKYFETCDEYLKNGYNLSGVYRLQRPGHYDFSAHCMMNRDGDGKAWMIMQKRTGDSVAFWNRTLQEYAQGFGDPVRDSWLGLRNVRHLVEAGHKLQLKMEIDGERCEEGEGEYYVGIWNFEIGSELEGFRLEVSRILYGNFTDSLANVENSNGKQFLAMDPKSNSEITCQEKMRTGGWWVGFNQCPFFSLNGEYSCNRPRSVYGLFVYQRQRSASGILSTGYLHPQATQMSLRICQEDTCM
ncbi:Fibrinogen C-terminal domain-containing protein [Aphelenchoides bicaudatus]|nr:Fibrinogen C-terminal domain-containing protein [Aphelenchoides bicaudatus]